MLATILTTDGLLCAQDALTSDVVHAIVEMVASNIFRDMPAPQLPNGPEFDPDEDDPTLAPDWEHVQVHRHFAYYDCCSNLPHALLSL